MAPDFFCSQNPESFLIFNLSHPLYQSGYQQETEGTFIRITLKYFNYGSLHKGWTVRNSTVSWNSLPPLPKRATGIQKERVLQICWLKKKQQFCLRMEPSKATLQGGSQGKKCPYLTDLRLLYSSWFSLLARPTQKPKAREPPLWSMQVSLPWDKRRVADRWVTSKEQTE